MKRKTYNRSIYDEQNSVRGFMTLMETMIENDIVEQTQNNDQFICITHTPSKISLTYANFPSMKTGYRRYMLDKLIEKITH